ncbi:MAG: right-handed parallel beta-helix repeat-containing protein [Anaerolineales bacterium]|nr:right-handed parallel beta-helix repeat-containing protein [Anaerolineales bacterium]
MAFRRGLLLLMLLPAGLIRAQAPARAAAELELYGTFHALGVIVNVDAGDDPDLDAAAGIAYRVQGSGSAFQPGFPLSRVSATRFVGSLFWLAPGTSYEVRVSLSDPDGGPLHTVTLQATVPTRAEIAVPTPTASFYASPAGSGMACSPAAPCAVSTALDQAQAGQAVVLRGGVYHQGSFSPPRSGAPGAPIVIRSYPGETAVFDGADPATFTWTAEGGGVYRTTVNVADPHLVTANGERLLPYTSLADLQNLVWGVPGFYASGAGVYVRLAGDADPNSALMRVSRFNTAFAVSRDFIYFVDLAFRHYGQGSYAKAIYFNNASDNLVQGSTFSLNDLSIGLKYDAHRNVIQDNVFSDTLFAWPWDAFYAGIDLSGGGLRFYSPATGRGTVIRRNTFYDYFDGLGVCPGTTAGQTNETDVYANLVYNTGDDGLETDGECSNVRLWGNTFHDVLIGISLAPVYTGPVYAIRNLIYRTGVGNSDYTGSPFKFNSGYGPSGPMYLFHNTTDAVLSDDDGPNHGLYIKAPGTWRLIYARNNIWAGTDAAINNYNTSQPVDLDFDNLWRDGGGALARWDNTNYATLAAFTAATGQEPSGYNLPPGFAGRAAGDYTLTPTSAMLDAGLALPGINDGYVGLAPDLGAFEYAGYGFTLTVSPAAQAAAPGSAASYRLDLQAIGAFAAGVSLAGSSPTPNLAVQVSPAALALPGQSEATLVVTNTFTGPLLPGLWHTVPITAAGGGLTVTASARLLVGGARLSLPLLLTP